MSEGGAVLVRGRPATRRRRSPHLTGAARTSRLSDRRSLHPSLRTVSIVAVRLVVRFWLWFCFKPVDVRHPEHVPADGPVLLCINHPNNLIDSLVVAAALRRKVHFLAAAAMFRNPLRRALPACVRGDSRLPEAGRPGQDGPECESICRLLPDARARRPRRDLSGRHHACRGARPAHQERGGPHRAGPRGGPTGRAVARPGGAHVRGAQVIPGAGARVLRRADPGGAAPRGLSEGPVSRRSMR